MVPMVMEIQGLTLRFDQHQMSRRIAHLQRVLVDPDAQCPDNIQHAKNNSPLESGVPIMETNAPGRLVAKHAHSPAESGLQTQTD